MLDYFFLTQNYVVSVSSQTKRGMNLPTEMWSSLVTCVMTRVEIYLPAFGSRDVLEFD
jgi:hypothetical protein